MSVVDSLIQRKAGQPSHYIEAGAREGGTSGHLAVEGGLRGHSVGELWPYRLVTLGNGSVEVWRGGAKVDTFIEYDHPDLMPAHQNASITAAFWKWCEDPANLPQYHCVSALPDAVREARAANVARQAAQSTDLTTHPGAC